MYTYDIYIYGIHLNCLYDDGYGGDRRKLKLQIQILCEEHHLHEAIVNYQG